MKNNTFTVIAISVFILILVVGYFYFLQPKQQSFSDFEFIRKNQYLQFVVEKQPLIYGPFRHCLGVICNPNEPIEGSFNDCHIRIDADPYYTTAIVFVENRWGEIGYAILKADFTSSSSCTCLSTFPLQQNEEPNSETEQK